MSDGETMARIMGLAAQSDHILAELTEHAKEQERVELHYNELQRVTKDLVSFLLATDHQTVCSGAWTVKRDVLVARALRSIERNAQRQGSEVKP